jgi:MoaA/NifB/PqqE/SkfB family radical SAM enzyme
MMKFIVFLCNYFVQTVLKRRIKPRVIQLPITNRCNSRCITCRIWRENSGHIDCDPAALKKALADPFFSKVHTVGINGGEPSLYPEINRFIESLFILKKLRRIYVISNGMISSKLLEMMETIKGACTERHIVLHLTISIDGIGAVHDDIRGIPGAFDKTMETLKKLKANKEKYCDILEAGCTLSIGNMPYVVELETYLNCLGIDSWYHPAVPNKRLHNFMENNFGVLDDTLSRMLATEYFFTRFKYGEKLKTRLRAFLTYYYFLHKGSCRLAGCNYLRSDITITENLDICLCAAASDIAGNLKNTTASALIKEGAFKQAEKETERHCQNCVHYIIFPTLTGTFQFVKELLKPSVWIIYKALAVWSR